MGWGGVGFQAGQSISKYLVWCTASRVALFSWVIAIMGLGCMREASGKPSLAQLNMNSGMFEAAAGRLVTHVSL